MKATKSDYSPIIKENFLSLSTEMIIESGLEVMAKDTLTLIIQCVKPYWTWKWGAAVGIIRVAPPNSISAPIFEVGFYSIPI